MLQLEKPEDFVIATGETHSVREFVEQTFALLNMPIIWEGSGKHEVGKHKETGKTLIEIDPSYYRPTEVDLLLGNAKKAQEKLNWTPSVSFNELVEIMVKADYDQILQTHPKANAYIGTVQMKSKKITVS